MTAKSLKKPTEAPLLDPRISEALLGYLGFLLGKTGQKLREFQEECLGPLGITGKHLGILKILQEKGSISQHGIGQCIHIDRTTMVDLIDDMEKKGLVERREHPTDRRSHAVYMTAKGKELLPKLHNLAKGAERKFLSSLNQAEQKEFVRLLKKLVLSHYTKPRSRGSL